MVRFDTLDDYVQYKNRGRKEIVVFELLYADIVGDALGGLLLSEIIYWHSPPKDQSSDHRMTIRKRDDDGKVYYWIACRWYEWWDRTRMTPDESETRVKRMIDMGILRKKVFRFKGKTTVHVRLVAENLLPLLEAAINNPSVNRFRPPKPLVEEPDDDFEDIDEEEEDVQDLSSSPENGDPDRRETGIRNPEKRGSLTVTTAVNTATTNESLPPKGGGIFAVKLLTDSDSELTEPEESRDIRINEPIRVDINDDGEEVGKRGIAKWRMPTKNPLCAQALAACGRNYFTSHGEGSDRSRWIKIEKEYGLPLDAQGTVVNPREWVIALIKWAEEENAAHRRRKLTRSVKIVFDDLLSAIENEDRKKDWISRELRARRKRNGTV